MNKLLEEQLINNLEYKDHRKEFLLLNTSQLYNKLEEVYQTTCYDNLYESYDMKEIYRRDYKLSLSEMYYNLGVFGLELQKIRK